MKNIWNWLGGGKNAVAGNPAAVPPVLPTPAVPTNHWRAGVLIGPFLTLVAFGIYLLCAGIGSVWKDAGIRLPSWGSGVKSETPAQTSTPPAQPAGDANPTIAEIAKLLASIPKSDVRDNVVTATEGSYGKIGGSEINVYTNAKVIPPKYTRSSVTVGGPGSATVEIAVPFGKSLGFTTPAGVTAEWQGHDGQWGPVPIGETPNQKKVRFTSVDQRPVQIDLLWCDAP